MTVQLTPNVDLELGDSELRIPRDVEEPLTRLKRKVADQKKYIAGLQRHRAKQDSRIKALTHKVADLMSERAQRAAQEDNAKARTGKSAARKLKSKLASSERAIVVLSDELTEAKREICRLEARLARRDGRIVTLRETLADMASVRAMAMTDEEALERYEAMEAEKRQIEAHVAKLEKELRCRPEAPSLSAEALEAMVWQRWVSEVPASERGSLIMDFRFGESFLPSLNRYAGLIDSSRVVRVVMWIASGTGTNSVCPRPWRDGPKGRQLERADGALAFRGNLESNSPSAPRIRWWRLPDSSLEFEFVCPHDAHLGGPA